ncbi:MAG: SIS domain-containing protein [Dehalococcoidia bacterium]
MNKLDDPSTYLIDASGMFGHIERLGLEFERAWLASAHMPVPAGSFDRVVIIAMGGSAAAADYFSAWATKESPVPVQVLRGYALPEYADERALVVALSYSGKTEEVLSCYTRATTRRCPRMVITSGGDLADRAATLGDPFHQVRYESSPRAALAHMLAPLVRLGQRLGLTSMCNSDIAAVREAHRSLVSTRLGREIPTEANPAKQLAELVLDGSQLVLLGEEHLAPAARRTKNQFAENAKMLASFEELPEAAHNVVVGLAGAGNSPVGLAFRSPSLARERATRDARLEHLFRSAGGEFVALPTRGISRLADQLEASAWGDFVSCYVALLRDIDPTPTPELAYMHGVTAPAAPSPA